MMTKAETNRRNGNRSKGPKTPGGKARSSRNALRHGLSLALSATPGFEQDVVDFAGLLAPRAEDLSELDQARAFAAAYLELKRVRQEKQRLLDACTERLGDEIDPKGSALNVLEVIDEFRRLENYERRWRTQVKKSAVRLKYVGAS